MTRNTKKKPLTLNDDERREFWNELRHELTKEVVAEIIAEKLRTGEIVVVRTDPDGTRVYQKTIELCVQ